MNSGSRTPQQTGAKDGTTVFHPVTAKPGDYIVYRVKYARSFTAPIVREHEFRDGNLWNARFETIREAAENALALKHGLNLQAFRESFDILSIQEMVVTHTEIRSVTWAGKIESAH